MRTSYFDGKISSGFVSLYTGRTIIMISTGLLGIFLPIFLYNYFDEKIIPVLFYYLIGNIFYFLLVALGAQFLNKFGFRKALRLSAVFGAAYYLSFYFLDQTGAQWWLWVAIGTLTFFRVFYWIPYHVDFAKFADRVNLGRELSAIGATRNVIGIFVPAIAGFIISQFNFSVLFIIAVILYLTSAIPYLVIPRTHENFRWSYAETFKQLFSKKNRKLMAAFVAYGAEGIVGLIVWPIFIFQLFKGNYLEVGAVSTLIVAATVIAQLLVGKNIDKKSQKEKLMHAGSVLNALGWIVKIFISTAFQVFVAGAYHSIVRIFSLTPFDVMTYEIAADQGHYVDEFTVIKEMALHTGKMGMLLAVAGMSLFLPIQWTFALAAVAAMLFNFLHSRGDTNLLALPHHLEQR